VSVLTDQVYFGGSKEDLLKAREANPLLPLLRKDFMIDPYQLYEAKAWGADVILLIAASLSPGEIGELSAEAHNLGLEVLLEVHDLGELQSSPLKFVDIVGVNNRNLKNFNESSVQASLDLVSYIPDDKVKISESCISDPQTIVRLREVGFKGFLIGETFMKTVNPAEALKAYINASRS
jgi:indole-3-glycerol phosphate synthase